MIYWTGRAPQDEGGGGYPPLDRPHTQSAPLGQAQGSVAFQCPPTSRRLLATPPPPYTHTPPRPLPRTSAGSCKVNYTPFRISAMEDFIGRGDRRLCAVMLKVRCAAHVPPPLADGVGHRLPDIPQSEGVGEGGGAGGSLRDEIFFFFAKDRP